jgi:hypothetical protein
MDDEPQLQNRRKFLRQVAKTLSVGLGFTLLAAEPAHAEIVQCCPNDGRCGTRGWPNPPGCWPGGSIFYCLPNAGCPGCCMCIDAWQCETIHWCPC